MTTRTIEVTLDASTAYLLEIASERQGLTPDELIAGVIYREMAARTGWPGQDGIAMRTALRDWLSGRADEEVGE